MPDRELGFSLWCATGYEPCANRAAPFSPLITSRVDYVLVATAKHPPPKRKRASQEKTLQLHDHGDLKSECDSFFPTATKTPTCCLSRLTETPPIGPQCLCRKGLARPHPGVRSAAPSASPLTVGDTETSTLATSATTQLRRPPTDTTAADRKVTVGPPRRMRNAWSAAAT